MSYRLLISYKMFEDELVNQLVRHSSHGERLRPNVSEWCNDTLRGACKVFMDMAHQQYVAEFENDADLIAFKLRWL